MVWAHSREEEAGTYAVLVEAGSCVHHSASKSQGRKPRAARAFRRRRGDTSRDCSRVPSEEDACDASTSTRHISHHRRQDPSQQPPTAEVPLTGRSYRHSSRWLPLPRFARVQNKSACPFWSSKTTRQRRRRRMAATPAYSRGKKNTNLFLLL